MAAGDISDAMLATVRDRLGDVGGVDWADADLWQYLNDGLVAVANHVCDAALYGLAKYATTALVAGTAAYALPTDLLRLRIVQYKGLYARRWDIAELEALRVNILTAPTETTPFYYVWNGQIIWANAVTQAGAEVYGAYYTKTPTTITTSVDPDVGKQFCNLVEDYAVARALERDERARNESELQMQRFLEQCELINRRYYGPRAYDGMPRDPAVGG